METCYNPSDILNQKGEAMRITCKKGSADFTKGKEYEVISHTNRGIIAIKNDITEKKKTEIALIK